MGEELKTRSSFVPLRVPPRRMIKLHLPLWELFASGAEMLMIAVLMIRGQLLKHRLRGELIGNKRVAARAASHESANTRLGQTR